MNKKQSAGILLFRRRESGYEVLLVHPGGPYWKNKDAGSWSIPKGEADDKEDLLAAAKREFLEETGVKVEGAFIPLSPVKQKGGKIVSAWALDLDIDAQPNLQNTFEIEWPPGSGNRAKFPEVDKAEWMSLDTARKKILPAQSVLIDELEQKVIPYT